MPSGVRLVVLGKQGAGKGTQCVRLARHYVVPHISTGDILRAVRKADSELAERLAKFMRAGELIPDDLVLQIVMERLNQHGTKERGFILDGCPRNVAQAEGLEELLGPYEIDLCVDLEVATSVVLQRLSKRRVCRDCSAIYSADLPPKQNWTCDVCGGEVVQREDDTEAAIRRRLELYELETAPLIAWYLERDELVTVDGNGSPDVVTARLVRAIDSRLAS